MARVVRREDAPDPGWYPDPSQRARLRWWDGSDWTDHERVRPRSAVGIGHAHKPSAAPPPSGPPMASGPQSFAQQAAAAAGAAASGPSREDMSAFVNEVRRATRGEIDRATKQLTAQATDVRSQLEPLVEEYGGRFLRFARRAAIFAVVLYVAYAVLTASVQGSLLEWVGDRVDGVIQDLTDTS